MKFTEFSFIVPSFENEEELADRIAEAIEKILGREINLEIQHIRYGESYEEIDGESWAHRHGHES